MSDQNEDNSFEEMPPEEYQPAEEGASAQPANGNNRNFMIAIGVIGALFVLALITMAVVAATALPARQAAQKTQAAVVLAQNASTAESATQVALAQAQVMTPSSTPPPTATIVLPTNTPVIAVAIATEVPTEIPASNKAETPDPAVLTQIAAGGHGPVEATLSPAQARTATLSVLLTQVAGGTTPQVGGGIAAAATATALPSTGFADEVGLPGLLAAAGGLLLLILLARGLRLSTRS